MYTEHGVNLVLEKSGMRHGMVCVFLSSLNSNLRHLWPNPILLPFELGLEQYCMSRLSLNTCMHENLLSFSKEGKGTILFFK